MTPPDMLNFAEAFVQRYSWLARWDAAGRPAFLLLLAFLAQRNLRRSYLSWSKARLQLRAAAAVTLQAAFRAMAARRELELRRRARAAVCIQVTNIKLPIVCSWLRLYWGCCTLRGSPTVEHFVVSKQARWRAHRALWSYLAMKRASLTCQCAWRQSMARRQLGKLRLVLDLYPHLLLTQRPIL